MDRDVQSRRQKSGAASHASSRPRQNPPRHPQQAVPPKKGLGSRVGLEKRSAAPQPPRGKSGKQTRSNPGKKRQTAPRTPPRSAATPQRQTPQRPAPDQQNLHTAPRETRTPDHSSHRYRRQPTNPQAPGYRQGAARPPRRVTQVEKMRIRRRRKIVGVLCLLVVLAVGVALSVNLLFKVTGFRVENTDRTTPANTGIYTEQQIIDLLGVQTGDNLFGFSTKEKSEQLQTQLPYLDVVEVNIQLPGTVVIKVQPATERFTMEATGGWLVLSDGLKVLRTAETQPDGLILLDAAVQQNSVLTAGSYLTLTEDGTLPAATPETAETAEEEAEPSSEEETLSDDLDASADTEENPYAVNETLFEIVDKMEEQQLLDGVTMISLRDEDEISFLYQGRVSVLLGTSNNLDYKMRMAANVILDVDGKGLTPTDHGTLDVSYQRSDGDIVAYFLPADPTPTPTPTPDTDTASGDGGESGDSDDSGSASGEDGGDASSGDATDSTDTGDA